VKSRIDTPVDPEIIRELQHKFEDFRRAYAEDGLSIDEFDAFGPTRRTLRQFTEACHDIERIVRDLLIPNPDTALGA